MNAVVITTKAALPIDIEAIQTFCERNGIRKLSLFGSVLRKDFRPDSDVDILIEFEPEKRIGYFGFVGLQFALSDILGREVDLHTPETISKQFRQKVLDTAQAVYERA